MSRPTEEILVIEATPTTKLSPYPVQILQHAYEQPYPTAVRWEAGDLTYRQLVDRAFAVARQLADRQIGRGDLVGLHLPLGPGLVVGMLGISLAGAAPV